MKWSGLRGRTLGPPLVVVTVVSLASSWYGLRRERLRFEQMESLQVAQMRSRAGQIMTDAYAQMESFGRDWAQWDDAVAWLDGKAPAFARSNLTPTTLSILKQDALVYWNRDLSVRGRLGESGPDSSLERDLRSLVAAGRTPCTGLVASGNSLWMATVQPVRTSDGNPRVHGWFALARRMGAQDDSALGRILLVPASILSAAPVRRRVGGDSLISSVELDLVGEGRAFLAFRMDRPLLRMGREATRQILIHLLISMVFAMAASLFVLDRMVLHRIARLAKGVEKIRETGGECSGVADPGRDEIGELSLRIDEMVAGLKQVHRELGSALDKAESAGRARGNFLASMTHELRTPLNGVIGLTEYVMKGDLDAERREALELSRGAALGLLETINGVLEYSRLEKGAVELLPEDVDLSLVVMDMAKVVAPIADAKGVDLCVLGDPRFPRLVRTDPARLRQILNNLVGNAVKFTAEGGVVLSVKLERLEAAGAQVLFEVADTGVGIPPQRQRAIFDPFEQSSPETAVRFGGTGLGLTIARDLVRAMGGDISVESRPGEGSRFRFSIPMEVVDPRAMVERDPSIRCGVRIEIANPAFACHLRALFQTAGVEETADGVLVTDSPERARADPGPTLLLCRNSLVRHSRVVLGDVQAQVLAVPCGNRAVLVALEKASRPPRTILLLATGLILREVVRGMLERDGHAVESPATPEQAWQCLARHPIDLAVVDLDDPSWDAIGQRMAVRVGLSEAEGRPEPVVRKPVKAERLVAAVRSALDGLEKLTTEVPTF
jgi:signal transduction histidine kinase